MEIADPYIRDPASIEPVKMKGYRDTDANAASQSSQSQPDEPLSIPSPFKRLFHRVLIIAPKNTLQNWEVEFRRWTPPDILQSMDIYVMSSETGNNKDASSKLKTVQKWFEKGGILIMSYQMFRGKVADVGDDDYRPNKDQEKEREEAEQRKQYQQYLLNPGPDLVIADEAHMIKNKQSKVTKTFQSIRTKRRIALTGSPLQNNLEEYWCMVDWVKQRALYSLKEYKERFMEPIKLGEHKGATPSQIREMKKRTHVLHTKLKHIVQRKDMRVLQRQDMPPKREFVLVIKMTNYQKFLYKYFISLLGDGKGRFMFKAYQGLLRVFNHPLCAVMQWLRSKDANNSSGTAASRSATATPNPVTPAASCQTAICATSSASTSAITTVMATASCVKTVKRVKPQKHTLEELKQLIGTSYGIFMNQSTAALQQLELAADKIEDNAMTTDTRDNKKKRFKVKGSKKKRKQHRRNSEVTNKSDKVLRDSNKSVGRWVAEDMCEIVDSDEDDAEASDDDIGDFIVDDDDDGEEGADEDYEEDSDYSGSDSGSDDAEGEEEDATEAKVSHNGDEDESSLLSCDSTDENEANFEVLGRKRKSDDVSKDSVDELKEFGHTDLPPSKMMKVRDSPLPDRDSNSGSPQSLISSKADDDSINVDDHHRVATDVSLQEKSRTPSPTLAFLDETALEEVFLEDEEAVEDEILGTDWWQLKTFNCDSISSPPPLSVMDLVMMSSKMTTLISLLTLSVKAKDKMIVFSQSLLTLNLIELFLQSNNWGEVIGEGVTKSHQDSFFRTGSSSSSAQCFSNWALKKDYVRIDGSTNNRQKVIDDFNKNPNIKVILISTKAGNMGINLQAANRVVLFDCSWNPVHDLQAIYRSYRLGQTRNVFVYRLISGGSMEEKIYKRQVQKQALAARVVDAQMPDNIFTAEEQAELLKFDDKDKEAEIEKVKNVIMSGTSDPVLEQFVEKHGRHLLEYIEDNDFLLVDKEDEHLNEEERKEAEAEFEREVAAAKRAALPPALPPVPISYPPPTIVGALVQATSTVVGALAEATTAALGIAIPGIAGATNMEEDINQPSTDEDSRSLVSEDGELDKMVVDEY